MNRVCLAFSPNNSHVFWNPTMPPIEIERFLYSPNDVTSEQRPFVIQCSNKWCLLNISDFISKYVKEEKDGDILMKATDITQKLWEFSSVCIAQIQAALPQIQICQGDLELMQRLPYDIHSFAACQCSHDQFGGVSLFQNQDQLVGCYSKSSGMREVFAKGTWKRIFRGFLYEKKPPFGLQNVAIMKPKVREEDMETNLLQEWKLDRYLPDSPYLARILSFIPYFGKNQSGRFLLAAPLAEGDLWHHGRFLSFEQKKQALHDILSGVAALHRKEMNHGDLSLGNCLIFNQGKKFVVTDFGFLHTFSDLDFSLGTTYFLAPEGWQYLHDHPEERAHFEDKGTLDAWALGVMFCQLFFNQLPPQFQEKLASIPQKTLEGEKLQAYRIFQQEITDYIWLTRSADMPQSQGVDIRRILVGLLTIDVFLRISVVNALEIFEKQDRVKSGSLG